MFSFLESNVPFFYLVKASCFSLPGQVFCLFLFSARNSYFLGNQDPTVFPQAPKGNTAGGKFGQGSWERWWKSIRPLDPNSPLIPSGWVMAA